MRRKKRKANWGSKTHSRFRVKRRSTRSVRGSLTAEFSDSNMKEPRRKRGTNLQQKGDLLRRDGGRSTSTPIGFDKLLKRVNKRIKIEYDTENKSKSPSQRRREIERKQRLANQRREQKFSGYAQKLERFEEKVKRIKAEKKKQLEDKRRKRIGKEKAVIEKKRGKLLARKQIARFHRMKANEISFLRMLQKESRKRELDEKLEETRKRKKRILEAMREERREKRRRQKRKLEKQRQSREKTQMARIKKIQGKMGRAQKRRREQLRQRAKGRHSGRKLRIESDDELLLEFDDTLEAAKLEMLLAKRKLDSIMRQGTFNEHASERASSFDFADLSEKEKLKLDRNGHGGRASNKKKRKKKGRKKRHRVGRRSQMEEESAKGESLNDKILQNYYKFLIKESDHGLMKKRKLSYGQNLSESEEETRSKRLSIATSDNSEHNLGASKLSEGPGLLEKKEHGNIRDSFTQISELPELICRDIRKSKKPVGEPETRLCILCDQVLEKESDQTHLNSKEHKKNKSLYIYTSLEESNCIVLCTDRGLVNERFMHLRKKSKKIRHQISAKCLKYETKQSSKETYTSENKKKLKTLALELEKQLGLAKRDLEEIRFILEQLKKTLDKNVENDLHICRQVKIPVLLIDFFKSVVSCPKFDLSTYIELIDKFFGLLLQICLMRENRVSIFYHNRVTSLADLLLWGWANMHKHVLILNFLPDVFQTLNLLLKQRLFKHSEVIKPLVIEYIFYSGLLPKLRQKFLNYASNNTLVLNPRVAVLTLKALTLLDTLTSLLRNKINLHIAELTPRKPSGFLQVDAPGTNFKKKGTSNHKLISLDSSKESDSQIFILNETECAGCLHLLASILLSKGGRNRRQFQTTRVEVAAPNQHFDGEFHIESAEQLRPVRPALAAENAATAFQLGPVLPHFDISVRLREHALRLEQRNQGHADSADHSDRLLRSGQLEEPESAFARDRKPEHRVQAGVAAVPVLLRQIGEQGRAVPDAAVSVPREPEKPQNIALRNQQGDLTR